MKRIPGDKKPIPVKVWLALVFLVIFICLTMAATTVFRELVRDQLVIPLLGVLNLLHRLVGAIDTDLIWGVFIVAIYVWVLLSLPSLGRTAPKTGVYSDKRSRTGRLQHWLHEVHEMQSQNHLTRFVTLELKKLILNTVAFREQCSLRQAEQWLSAPDNQRQIPHEVQLLLHADPSGQVQAHSLWQALKHWLLRYPTLPKTPTHFDLEPILRFLEAQDVNEYKPDRPINQ
jgi:hypothetical protein